MDIPDAPDIIRPSATAKWPRSRTAEGQLRIFAACDPARTVVGSRTMKVVPLAPMPLRAFRRAASRRRRGTAIPCPCTARAHADAIVLDGQGDLAVAPLKSERDAAGAFRKRVFDGVGRQLVDHQAERNGMIGQDGQRFGLDRDFDSASAGQAGSSGCSMRCPRDRRRPRQARTRSIWRSRRRVRRRRRCAPAWRDSLPGKDRPPAAARRRRRRR